MWREDPLVQHLTKITELNKPPEVGTWYAVPTYRVIVKQKVHHLPVLTPSHEDGRLFRFPIWHYHLDLRFIHDNELRKLMDTHIFIKVKKVEDWHYLALGDVFPLVRTMSNRPDSESLLWKAVPCVRDYHPVKNTNLHRIISEEPRYQQERPYCGKCPHRGVNLDQVKPDADGIRVCPAHGGRWKVADGKISAEPFFVPRLQMTDIA